MTKTTHSVLRIGPLTNPNASLLRTAIASHFQSSSSQDRSEDEDELIISNRYFTASVLLKGLHQDDTTTTTNDDRHCVEDGLILVFNAEQSSSQQQQQQHSFDSLQSIHEAAISTNRAGETLRIIAGIYYNTPPPLSDGSKQSEAEYSRRVLWCLDYGYEYLEIDMSERGRKSGWDTRDKEGFARCIEAVGGCMWSSHVMKQRGGGGVDGGSGNTSCGGGVGREEIVRKESQTATAIEEVGGVTRKDDEQDNAGTTATTLESSSSMKQCSDADREAAAMQSLLKGVQVNDEESNLHDEDEKNETNQQQQEISFSELEHVMNEAKRIRQASKNECMTDEERRKRAGDTAVRLMGLLERLGFDDDSSNDEDDCENDESDVDDLDVILANREDI
eukprot:scaffold248345_cov39-Cyclotella_meneghiniana.AAC.1